jgi:NTE family protein
MPSASSRKIGLALGGGSARGWAHVGVLRGLEKRGIRPDVVCGTSAGALVGAAYALGKLDEIERWLALLQWRDVVGYLDFSFGFKGGVIKGRRLFDFFAEHVGDRDIEDLPIPFGVVATDLANGDEIWLRSGSLFHAVRASVSIPGFLRPVKIDGRWLVDGGLVDPVPVALCRELGADVVLGVDINKSLLDEDRPLASNRPSEWQDGDTDLDPPTADEPGLLEVIERSLYITQSRLARARAKTDPADVLISPAVGHIGFVEFHRAADSFDAGRAAVEQAGEDLDRVLGSPPTGSA